MGAVAIAEPFPLTGTDFDALTNGSKWELDSTRVITWALADGTEQWTNVPLARSIVSSVLTEFEKVANIKFQYVGHVTDPALTTANIVYTGATFLGLNLYGFPIAPIEALAKAFFPVESLSDAQVDYIFGAVGGASVYPDAAGDVWLNVDPWVWPSAVSASTYAGSYFFFVLLHETGHALGLKHPHDDGGTGRPTYASLGYSVLDIDVATIMSYNESNPASYGYVNSGHPGTPMVADILALQWLYGSNLTTGAGNDVYLVAQDGVLRTIWDAGGTDAFDARQLLHSVTIDLNTTLPYAVVTSTSASLGASGVVIENAYGSLYADSIYGNQYSNVLSGGGGNDILDGRGGIDTSIYASIRTSYTITKTSTGLMVSGGAEGTDTLTSIERLQFSNKKLAFDTDGSAGNTAKIIGAAYGISFMTPENNKEGIAIFDAGYTMKGVAELVLTLPSFVNLAGPQHGNTDFVNLVYKNVVGTLPPAGDLKYYVDILNNGMSQADLLVFAANCDANTTHINLVGLASTGLEYV